MKKSARTQIATLGIGLLSILAFFPAAQAFNNNEYLINNIATYFDDGGPVTVPIDVRISLWSNGEVESDDIDGSGDIVIADDEYGGYQTVVTYTPLADGYVGFDFEDTTDFPTFPELFDSNAYLQVEFKYPVEANTAYRLVDMVSDSPDLNDRILLVDNLASLNANVLKDGVTNDDYTLDINFNSAQFVNLIFGSAGRSLGFDHLSSWFNMDARLNINGFAGVKLAINADAGDSETQMLSIRNSGGTPIFYVDEDGDATLLGDIQLSGNELLNARLENLASAPTCNAGAAGRMYHDTVDDVSYVCNGAAFTLLDTVNSTHYHNGSPITNLITASFDNETTDGATTTVWLTDDQTSGGNLLFSDVYYVSAAAGEIQSTAEAPALHGFTYNSGNGQLQLFFLESNLIGLLGALGLEGEESGTPLNIFVAGI